MNFGLNQISSCRKLTLEEFYRFFSYFNRWNGRSKNGSCSFQSDGEGVPAGTHEGQDCNPALRVRRKKTPAGISINAMSARLEGSGAGEMGAGPRMPLGST
jgi:hypothetical protein